MNFPFLLTGLRKLLRIIWIEINSYCRFGHTLVRDKLITAGLQGSDGKLTKKEHSLEELFFTPDFTKNIHKARPWWM